MGHKVFSARWNNDQACGRIVDTVVCKQMLSSPLEAEKIELRLAKTARRAVSA
jgi:hypothetical protein